MQFGDSTKKISYFFNPTIGEFNYGYKHFMNPKRIAMAHSLIVGYGVYASLDHYETREASAQELVQFHSQDYIDYLSNYVSPDKMKILSYLGEVLPEINEDEKNNIDNQKQFSIGIVPDNPGFEGVYTFSQLSAGGSIDAAHLIINDMANIAINYGGGLHHAKKREASGFCYINDIVLCILELLKVYPRVLYIDIDVHHGDGVEEAFCLTNRVMTVSFHEYGANFFPGTGSLNNIGEGFGLHHSVNVPLLPGMTDDMYRETFQSVINMVNQSFKPDAIVLQCGADSCAYDRIGNFNMSIKGHGECVKFITQLGIPLVVLGGGGYTIHNVSRCWAYEAGLITGQELSGKIPEDDKYYLLYGPNPQLHFPIIPNFENQNTQKDINKIIATIGQNLKDIEGRPGVQFHHVPETFLYDSDDEIEEEDEIGQKLYEREIEIKCDGGYEQFIKKRKIHQRTRKGISLYEK
ncbi:hypothetical protein PPERSA_02344 [Pseudocohnilembus persalinus]|uniref:Histone deacetylase n=1 Tax=Pseudocohnilembus persalinus TaxID=266149 RepID=A0A0V0QU77_PSEPJ|nr:hypothetical protein PPERSA_02344 [Pseudocohnilembus persalinus]|eukprot:KRX05812.1 hypothetical protein PPERSA_02344 [Pseudocohnilembus persalinus]